MPSDFVTTNTSKTAKRTYATEQGNLPAWRAGIDAFVADTTMGLAQKTLISEYYKVPVKYWDTQMNERGVITVKVDTPAAYDAVMNSLAADQDLSDTIAGVGSDCSEDETEASWVVRYSCVLYDANYKKDTFSVTFYKKYAIISGYEKDETLAVLETWFDANAVFA